MIKELKRIIEESEVMKEDDNKWPKKNIVGKQELEIRCGNEHVSFEVKSDQRVAPKSYGSQGYYFRRHWRKLLS